MICLFTIETERYERQSLAESDNTRISARFIDEFYCGLPNNIQILVDKRDEHAPVEIYVMVERPNEKIEEKDNSQNQSYAAVNIPLRTQYRDARGTIIYSERAGKLPQSLRERPSRQSRPSRPGRFARTHREKHSASAK